MQLADLARLQFVPFVNNIHIARDNCVAVLAKFDLLDMHAIHAWRSEFQDLNLDAVLRCVVLGNARQPMRAEPPASDGGANREQQENQQTHNCPGKATHGSVSQAPAPVLRNAVSGQ